MEFELPIDFKELLQTFNRHAVKYLLIGGYAVGLHGHVRATNDIDLVVAPDEENADKVIAALTDFGLAGSNLKRELFTTPRSLVVMGVEPFAVDILNYLEGVELYEAYERREVRQAEDIEVSLVSLADLLTNKAAVARDKDLLDVKELKRINKT
jgi:predicted nucleotidyltransferase